MGKTNVPAVFVGISVNILLLHAWRTVCSPLDISPLKYMEFADQFKLGSEFHLFCGRDAKFQIERVRFKFPALFYVQKFNLKFNIRIKIFYIRKYYFLTYNMRDIPAINVLD